MKIIRLSTRDRIRQLLYENRLVASIELFIISAIRAFEFVNFPSDLFLFPLGWISLRLRKFGWRGVGLRRPASWSRVLGLGALIGVTYQLVEFYLIDPLVIWLSGKPMDLSQFDSMRGSIPNLVAYIIIGWLFGGLLEELVYRGYLLNRFTDVFGSHRTGITMAILASSALFAIGHINMGIPSVLENFIFALVFAGLYATAKRNLWLPILAHGFYNTLGLILIYLAM